MSEISLQAYENEIDQLIEQTRYLEALAHIRHLLTQFPHYVGAYYLLGKTTLEADLPELAIDMFRRALSADPEHLVSRIGLGLAHERRNDLDAALWNLERALETDPSSSEIAEELRRMYSRRDGMELAYVPQTRAGLAHLYLRGQRPERAAEELHALLEEQSARPDLMTALAEAYWRNGQLVQSSEVCQEILDKMPYNIKANLLLGTLWVNSGQDEGWIYLKRAEEIDPENRRAEELFGADSLLEPRQTVVDRLAYDPDAIDVDQDSTWFKRLEAASITVGISEAPPEMTADEVRLVDITAGLESQIEIPDWLRELGTGQEQEQEEGAGGLGWMADIEFTESDEAVETAEAEVETPLEGIPDLASAFGIEPEAGGAEGIEEGEAVPDWLQELAPDELSLGPEEAEGAPDWLLELAGEGPVADEEAPPLAVEEMEAEQPAESMAAEDDMVDWIAELTAEDEELLREGTPETTEVDESLPDWLGELQTTTGEAPGAGEEEDEDLLGWMTDELPEAATEVAEPASPDELPDWLSALQLQAEGEQVAGETSADVELPEAEELPDWLAGLEPTTPAAVGEEEYPEEEIPDWLRELEPESAEPSVALISEAEPVSEEEGILTGEAALAWLQSLTAGEEEAESEVAAWVEPEWTEPATEIVPPAPSAVVEEPATVEPVAGADEVPAETLEATTSDEMGGLLSSDDTLAWLESLATVEEVPEESEPAPSMMAVEEAGPGPEPVLAGVEAAQVVAPAEEDELMSGDDALAWLQSFTVGKEEELQALAERESADRVAEILGRKREVPADRTEIGRGETHEQIAEPSEESPEVERLMGQPDTLAEVVSDAEIPEVMESAVQGAPPSDGRS